MDYYMIRNINQPNLFWNDTFGWVSVDPDDEDPIGPNEYTREEIGSYLPIEGELIKI